MEIQTELIILDKMLEPVARCFTPAVATQIAELGADSLTQARINELAAKCNAGELTEAEEREYAAYVEAIDLIGLLQAKARAIIASSCRADGRSGPRICP
jgi:endonuclease III